jgi:archaellum component FlaF (FlaF/FlaG flagellin family)
MKGIVLREYQDLSKNYPITMGDMLLDHSDLEFDDINRGDQQVQVIHIYNGSTKVAQPNLMHLPPYLSATMVPERLGPGRAGMLTVTLNSNLLHDYGLTQSSVYLAENPGDTVSADHEIAVSAVLLPSFLGMTAAQKQYAPKMQLSKTTVDINFNGKSKKKDVIEITNKGRTELDISSLQLFTGGLKVSLGKSKLKPGEKTELKITAMRDELKKVRTRPRILMITNDPDHSKVTITINAK